MAVFQLGAIVTKIKGSIGGTAFKTQRATNVIYRKSNGYSKSKLLSNPALQYARYIFTRWAYLTPEQQSGWQNMAALIFFPDKFGNQVHISGRQLYTKTNLNLKKAAYFEDISPTFSTVIPVLDVEDGVINPVSKYLTLGVEYFDNATAYVEVSAQVSVNNLQSPVYNRRETLIFPLVTGAELLDLGAQFFAKFPYVTNGYNVRLYVTPVNIYGIKGTPIAVPVNFLDIDFYYNAENYVIQNDFNVFINVDTNLPTFTLFRMYYQTSDVAMPEPDFENAVEFFTTGLPEFPALSARYRLALLPANLRYGNFVRLWIEPIADDVAILPAISLEWSEQRLPLYDNEPVSALFDSSNNVVLTIDSNLPAGTSIRIFAQFDATEYPEQNIEFATQVGDFPLELDGTVLLGQALVGEPYNLDLGYKMVLWYQPFVDTFAVDTPLPLQLEEGEPALFYPVTNSELRYRIGGGSEISATIFNNTFNAAFSSYSYTMIFVQFLSWTDPLLPPSVDVAVIDTGISGTVKLIDMFDTATLNPTLRRIEYTGLKPAFNTTTTVNVPTQG